MPVLIVDDGKSSARVGHYLYFDREGHERAEGFSANTSAANMKEAEKEFRATREFWNKQDEGREFFQAYISFHPKELGDMSRPDGSPDWERLVEYGREWARRADICERHQLYVVAHGDKPHPHLHIVWNATSHVDGRKYHYQAYGPKQLERFRDLNDMLARQHGITRLPDRTRDSSRAPDGVIRAVERGGDRYSWKVDLQARIRAAASESLNERQFRAELRKRGVDVKARAGEYSFAFRDDLGKQRRVRARSLGEEYQRKPLAERFRAHSELTRQPGGYLAMAEKAKQEKAALDSWRRDLRTAIGQAKRRAHDWPSFERSLERRGIRVDRPDEGALRYSLRSPDGQVKELRAPDLGRAYEKPALERLFEENAFRRAAASDIGKAARKAQDLEDFRARLSASGITVSRVGERLQYQLPPGPGGPGRTVEGEALGRPFRTERIEERFAENRDRRELFQLAMRERHQSTDRADYVGRLETRGVTYRVDDQGKGHLRFRGREFDAGQLGPANPDRGTFGDTSPASLARRVGREAGGLVQELNQEITRASHPGYHDHGTPEPGRERERTRKRGMDTTTTGAEQF